MRRAQVRMVCRGEHMGFACIQLTDAPSAIAAHATAKDTNCSVPVRLVSLADNAYASSIIEGIEYGSWWVCVIPLLACDCKIDIEYSYAHTSQTFSFIFGAHTSRYMSRLLSMRTPSVAEFLRNLPHTSNFCDMTVRFDSVWDTISTDEEGCDVACKSWRFEARFVCAKRKETTSFPISLDVLDEKGSPLSARIYALEEQHAPLDARMKEQRETQLEEHRATFAVVVPTTCTYFIVRARMKSKDHQHAQTHLCEAWYTVHPKLARALVAENTRATTSADGDPRYAVWFEEHKASCAKLDFQKNASRSMEHPSFSLVLPIFNTAPAELIQSIEAVRAQSYGVWQLILLDASEMLTNETYASKTRIHSWLDTKHVLQDPRIIYQRMENPNSDITATSASVPSDSSSDNSSESTDVAHPLVSDLRTSEEQRISQRFSHHNSYLACATHMATGDYVLYMSEAGVLTPDALWEMACRIQTSEHSGIACDLLYCDEDHLSHQTLFAPQFKSAPSMLMLEGTNYLGHCLAVRREHIAHLSLPLDVAAIKNESYDRSFYAHIHKSYAHIRCLYAVELYDLAMRALEAASCAEHIANVLYHHRDKTSEVEETMSKEALHMMDDWGLCVVSAHLKRMGIPARAEHMPDLLNYRLRYETPAELNVLPTQNPLVSIVIPTSDHVALLRACVSSILTKSVCASFEIILVENNSTQEETFAYYKEIEQADPRVHVVKYDLYQGFNYSALVNFGVSQTHGQYVVILNNDTEVITPLWIHELVGCLDRKEVGIVGAKLLYKDGLIQHAGMIANDNGDFAHVNQNLSSHASGYQQSLVLVREYSMVTGALHAMRREVFEELGGYDEALKVGFNDGDICLRARALGYKVVFNPFVCLYHREFSSRGREAHDATKRSRYLQEKAYMLGKHATFFAGHDPFFNANLNSFSNYFQLKW